MNIEYTVVHTIQELVDLMMLRVEVFVVEQKTPHEEEPDEFDKVSTLIVARAEGRIVGTVRFRPVGDQAKIERIAVKKEYRRKGIGTDLVRYALEQIEKERLKNVYLHAQTTAEDFYRKLGFQPVGEPFMEAGIEHVKMVKGV
jgi:predicted GNAT family N-acyltransferase